MGVNIPKEFYVDIECECGNSLMGRIDSEGKLITEKCTECRHENYLAEYEACQKIKEDA